MRAQKLHRGLSTHVSEAGNVALALLESTAFGAGVWFGLSLLGALGQEPARWIAIVPEAPVLTAILFLVGRIWVGRNGLELPWIPRVPDSIVLGILFGLTARVFAWGWELVAAYVPSLDTVVLGLSRGAWRATALVAPYAFAADRPARRRAA
jgi:hypothetical protein